MNKTLKIYAKKNRFFLAYLKNLCYICGNKTAVGWNQNHCTGMYKFCTCFQLPNIPYVWQKNANRRAMCMFEKEAFGRRLIYINY